MAEFGLSVLRKATESLFDLICPPECLWCEHLVSRHRLFCSSCHSKFISDYYRCLHCATPIPNVVPNKDCHRCRKANWKFTRVYTLGPYRNELRDAVILMKKPGYELLRRAIARLMAEFLLMEKSYEVGESFKPPVLVPVPNHWSHAFGGAADVAGVLASEIAKRTGWEDCSGIVRRIRKTDKQGMMAWSERAGNVRGAFKIPKADSLNGRHVILVDDVLTSGATAGELAKCVLKAGAKRVDVAVAARGTGAKESRNDASAAPARQANNPDQELSHQNASQIA